MRPKQKHKNNYKILENFKKELVKQLYKDLFKLNKDLYINEDITYEFFLFHYYSIIEENINFNKPDYPGLVDKMNSIITQNILNNKQNKEKNKEIEELYENNEWELINKYKSSLEMEKKLKEKKEREEKIKKYNEELNKQIENNKMLKNKNIKVNKEDKYLLDEKEAKKELMEIKIDKSKDKLIENDKNIKRNIQEEEKINMNILEENIDKDEIISKMVDKIMKQKREEKIDSILNGMRSKNFIEQKEYIMPEIKYDPKKIDELIKKEMLKYQDI
jgi:hypothetical protein